MSGSQTFWSQGSFILLKIIRIPKNFFTYSMLFHVGYVQRDAGNYLIAISLWEKTLLVEFTYLCGKDTFTMAYFELSMVLTISHKTGNSTMTLLSWLQYITGYIYQYLSY